MYNETGHDISSVQCPWATKHYSWASEYCSVCSHWAI